MAVNHNFKEGIDWVTDPTGETPLANHIFVSKSGNDSTGDGSPQTPYLTIQKASDITQATTEIIVIGSGLYNESSIDNLNNQTLKGDGYVILEGNGSNTLSNLRGIFENIILIRWGNIAVLRQAQFNYCTVVDSSYTTSGGTASGSWIGSIFINCTLLQPWTGLLAIEKSIFINTSFSRGISTSDTNIKNCFIDENSIIENNESSGSLTFCAINGIVLGFLTKENNIENINPFFNNKTGFDLSVTSSSELIGAGENGSNIGNVFISKGLFQGVSELDSAIDSNVNLAYNSLGEIELQGGAAAAETFETAEEEALELSVLGTTRISGFPDLVNNTPDNNNALVNPNQLILEINVALLDGIYTGWKEYRWNEQPTQNADGTPNGDSSYDWSDNNKVSYKKRKYRISVRSDYNQA